MLEILLENWGTLLVGLLVLAAVVGIVGKMVRDKMQGKSSCSCGCGGCSGCGGACHGQPHQADRK